MTRRVGRFVAVDWSGARDVRAQHEHIWVAVVEDGALVELSAGRTREETVEYLLAPSGPTPPGGQVVGLDFSFGFPEWFARAHACADGPAAWALAAREGERWLRDCPPPFFGPKGTHRPPGVELHRGTEREVRASFGLHPKSVFQLAGPGAVGVGSLRGMPLLAQLRAGGFAVWPFDHWGPRTVVELYPALAVRGSPGVAQPDGRRRFLDRHHPGTTSAWPAAVASRDAFDAVVAAYLLADYGSFAESGGASQVQLTKMQVAQMQMAQMQMAQMQMAQMQMAQMQMAQMQREGAMWLPPPPSGRNIGVGPSP